MLNIKYLTSQDVSKWDDYVRDSSSATFFHLTGWKRVIEKTFKHKSFYIFVEGDGRIQGVLPLFLVKSRLFGTSLVSVPFVVYGGICADNSESEAMLLEESKKIAQELEVDYLELRELNSENNYDKFVGQDLYVTFQSEISSDVEENMKSIPRKQRRMVRQGIKYCQRSEIGRNRLKEFYHIYSHSVRNLGTPVFPLRLFQNIMEEFSEECQILSVICQEKIVAVVMTFFYKNVVMPYYGGALKEYFKYSVNDFMYWELMRHGCENGYKTFDFGRSKKGVGSYSFKKHWGMTPRDLNYQYYLVKKKELPNLNPTNPKYEIFINLWKKLPLPVANIIGPRIVKNIP